MDTVFIHVTTIILGISAVVVYAGILHSIKDPSIRSFRAWSLIALVLLVAGQIADFLSYTFFIGLHDVLVAAAHIIFFAAIVCTVFAGQLAKEYFGK